VFVGLVMVFPAPAWILLIAVLLSLLFLSATGATTEVIIELTTAIPANAELRRYSLVESSPIAPNNILVFVGLVMVFPAPAWILLIAVLLSLLLEIPSPSSSSLLTLCQW
jgi:uncharacterized membrane protein